MIRTGRLASITGTRVTLILKGYLQLMIFRITIAVDGEALFT